MTRYSFHIWQDGVKVASAGGADLNAAWRDARHYAMMYERDGPVQIKERNRVLYSTPIAEAVARARSTPAESENDPERSVK